MGKIPRLMGIWFRRLQAVQNLVGSSGEIRMILSGLNIGVLACILGFRLAYQESGLYFGVSACISRICLVFWDFGLYIKNLACIFKKWLVNRQSGLKNEKVA